MTSRTSRNHVRKRVHARIRRTLGGSAERPRLAVFRSNRHIYVQLIDDVDGRTLASASTAEDGIRSGLESGGNVEAARAVGRVIADRAKDKGLETVVFDRGGFIYRGRVRALAESAREAGLKF